MKLKRDTRKAYTFYFDSINEKERFEQAAKKVGQTLREFVLRALREKVAAQQG